MSFIPGLRKRLTVEISDKQVNDTRYKQKAVRTGYDFKQAPDGQVTLHIYLTIQAFSSNEGGYGVYMGYKGIADKLDTLVGANDTLVDAATGALLALQGALSDEDWRAKIATFEQATMLQGDFFERLAASGAVDINALCVSYIEQANALGRWA